MHLKKPFLKLGALLLLLGASGCDRWKEIEGAVTVATKKGLEDYAGTLDTANLIPTAFAASESLGTSALGRTFRFGGPRLVSLEPTTPCQDFVPGEPKESNGGAVTQFSYSFLQMADQTSGGKLNLPYLGYSGALKAEFKEKSLVATKINLARVLGYSPQANWSVFETCCKLTATCGDFVITEMYQMSQTTKVMAFTKENMEAAVNAAGGDALKAVENVAGAVDFVHSSQKSQEIDSNRTFWSHFGFRQLPRSVESPLEGVYLSMEPNTVHCATNKNTSVSLRLKLHNVVESSAERLLGYNIAIPADWTHITLGSKHKDIVKVADGTLSCRPQGNKSCPVSLDFTATPPDCSSFQDLKRLDWPITLALYIPSKQEGAPTAYRPHKDMATTLVIPSQVKNVPVATLAETLLPVEFGTRTEGAARTSITVDTGDLLTPQFKVIVPEIHFAQILASPPINKSVGLDVMVSATICNDFRLSPTLLVPLKVLVWGKKPGAQESILFELPEMNLTVKPVCPKKDAEPEKLPGK